MIIKRGLVQIVLAALLLAAQHGALTHQIWHFQSRPLTFTQQYDGDKQGPQSQLCNFHVALAEVLGAVNPAVLPARIAANEIEVGTSVPAFILPGTRVTPAARGPPVLL